MLARRGGDGAGLDAAVAKIIADVRERGDRALIDFSAQFDRVKLTPATLRVTPAETAFGAQPDSGRRSPRARAGGRAYRASSIAARWRSSFIYRDTSGMRLGQMVRPLSAGRNLRSGRAGRVSVVRADERDSGAASRASREIVMVSPPSPRASGSRVLAAAEIAGVDEFYRVGGAQAVAALAYGTETIEPVDKIVGPGNAYVQAAKRMVYGVIDIDKMAGPSEVLVIADDRARPEWVAADLIAQAEHGSGDEAAVLLTTSRAYRESRRRGGRDALESLPRATRSRRAGQARRDGRGRRSQGGLRSRQRDWARASRARRAQSVAMAAQGARPPARSSSGRSVPRRSAITLPVPITCCRRAARRGSRRRWVHTIS